MTTKKTEETERTEETGKTEETREGFGCCCPPQFKEMLAKFGEGDKEACFARMQEMMKGGGCSPQK